MTPRTHMTPCPLALLPLSTSDLLPFFPLSSRHAKKCPWCVCNSAVTPMGAKVNLTPIPIPSLNRNPNHNPKINPSTNPRRNLTPTILLPQPTLTPPLIPTLTLTATNPNPYPNQRWHRRLCQRRQSSPHGSSGVGVRETIGAVLSGGPCVYELL